ncbi:substrate-binding periplasmic protein [Rhodovibrionaceae bacterium A322]
MSLVSSLPAQANDPVCDTVTVALTDNYFPFSFVDTQGRGNGIGLVVLEQAAQRAGVAVKTLNGLPWKRQLAMLKASQVDAILAINFNEERDKIFAFSDSYYANNIRVFLSKPAPFSYQNLSDLKGQLGLISDGTSYGGQFDSYAQEHLTIRGVKGTEKLVEMLALGRGDYIVLPEDLGRQLVQAKELSDTIVPVGPPVQSVPVHLAFSPDSTCLSLLPLINETIAEMIADGSRERLLGELRSNNKNWAR